MPSHIRTYLLTHSLAYSPSAHQAHLGQPRVLGERVKDGGGRLAGYHREALGIVLPLDHGADDALARVDLLGGDGGRQSVMDAKQVLVLGRKEDLLTQAINEEGHLRTYVLRSPARSGRARCRSAGAAARWRS